ncbi:MAG: DUF2071 domain-containing protein [Gemmatimonadales bacterium]
MLNYEVPESLLAPLVPRGTELDRHGGRLFASIVGFRFLGTRVRGIPIPFHADFEEVNLRFYVRRAVGGEWRRAVVFVRELVPKRAVAWVARLVYNEPYRRVPMSHRLSGRVGGAPAEVRYGWRADGQAGGVGGSLAAAPRPLERPSDAEFITEHYWGYTRQRDGGTIEYEVRHPPWDVADLVGARVEGDLARVYGPEWAELLVEPPRTAFYAVGSSVAVYPGERI